MCTSQISEALTESAGQLVLKFSAPEASWSSTFYKSGCWPHLLEILLAVCVLSRTCDISAPFFHKPLWPRRKRMFHACLFKRTMKSSGEKLRCITILRGVLWKAVSVYIVSSVCPLYAVLWGCSSYLILKPPGPLLVGPWEVHAAAVAFEALLVIVVIFIEARTLWKIRDIQSTFGFHTLDFDRNSIFEKMSCFRVYYLVVILLAQ